MFNNDKFNALILRLCSAYNPHLLVFAAAFWRIIHAILIGLFLQQESSIIIIAATYHINITIGMHVLTIVNNLSRLNFTRVT